MWHIRAKPGGYFTGKATKIHHRAAKIFQEENCELETIFCFIKYSCINASLNPTITPPKVTITTNNQKSVNIGTTPVQIPIIPKLILNWSI